MLPLSISFVLMLSWVLIAHLFLWPHQFYGFVCWIFIWICSHPGSLCCPSFCLAFSAFSMGHFPFFLRNSSGSVGDMCALKLVPEGCGAHLSPALLQVTSHWELTASHDGSVSTVEIRHLEVRALLRSHAFANTPLVAAFLSYCTSQSVFILAHFRRLFPQSKGLWVTLFSFNNCIVMVGNWAITFIAANALLLR